MKHLLKWVIPAGVLLLIGMWIGLNWDNFPANEVAYVPVLKKDEVKADTAVRKSVETSSDSLFDETEQMSHDSLMVEMTASEETLPDESATSIEVTEPDELTDLNNSSASIASERIASTPNKRVDPVPNQTVVLTNRSSNPEHASRNRNVTPSASKVSQPPAIDQKTTRPQTPRKEIVLESYMSKREIPVERLVTVDGTYKPAASGKGVGEATFVVHNRSGKNLKRVNVEVHYLAKDNRLLVKREMPVTNIEADGSINLTLPANAEADRLVYKVLYVSSDLGEFYYEPLQTYASVLR